MVCVQFADAVGCRFKLWIRTWKLSDPEQCLDWNDGINRLKMSAKRQQIKRSTSFANATRITKIELALLLRYIRKHIIISLISDFFFCT